MLCAGSDQPWSAIPRLRSAIILISGLRSWPRGFTDKSGSDSGGFTPNLKCQLAPAFICQVALPAARYLLPVFVKQANAPPFCLHVWIVKPLRKPPSARICLPGKRHERDLKNAATPRHCPFLNPSKLIFYRIPEHPLPSPHPLWSRIIYAGTLNIHSSNCSTSNAYIAFAILHIVAVAN